MNDKQALAEARRRWGKDGAIRAEKNGRRIVGHVVMGMFFSVEGEGRTWALAFAEHDRKAETSAVFASALGQPCPRCSRTIQSRHWARPVSDPETEPPTVDDVICNSCWLNDRLPESVHRWSEPRRERLYLVGRNIGNWVYVLARGDVVNVARYERNLREVMR